MAKNVKQAVAEAAARKARLTRSAQPGVRSVSLNFDKGFSAEEIQEIDKLRSEMAERLYASG